MCVVLCVVCVLCVRGYRMMSLNELDRISNSDSSARAEESHTDPHKHLDLHVGEVPGLLHVERGARHDADVVAQVRAVQRRDEG